METLQELEQKEKSIYLLSLGIAIPMLIDAGYLLIGHVQRGLMFYTFLVLSGLFVAVTLKLFFVYGREEKLRGDGKDGI